MIDDALTVDRGTRLQILTDANYKCQLEYPGICTINATELADVGGTMQRLVKAACKDCRRHRDSRRALGNRLTGMSMRRNR